MALELRNDPSVGRYELHEDGVLVAVADYRRDRDVVVVPHTEVARERRGQGLGAVLVAGMLDDVRAAGATVRPLCWYVAQFVDEHPEYADLVDR